MVKPILSYTAFALLALPVAALAVPSADAALQQLPLHELEAVYMDCERAAMRGLLSPGDAVRCSVAYEAFKQRAFDGDYERFRAWWQAQRLTRDTAQKGR